MCQKVVSRSFAVSVLQIDRNVERMYNFITEIRQSCFGGRGGRKLFTFTQYGTRIFLPSHLEGTYITHISKMTGQ